MPLPDSGLTPPGQVLNAVDIDARLDWYGTYVTITDQVMFVNQDPRMYGVVKSSLIDLKLLADEAEDNKAQAEQFALAA